MVFCHKSHDRWIIKHSLHQELHILADCVYTRTDMDRSDLPLLWFFNNTDEKLTQMRYGYWINKITEVVDIGFWSYRGFPEHSCRGSILLTYVNIFGCVHVGDFDLGAWNNDLCGGRQLQKFWGWHCRSW